jgi:hypothetical protein
MNLRNNDPKREVRTIHVPEFRVSREGKEARLVGHAAVFNQVGDGGWFREQIRPGAFAESIPNDDVRALFNHDPNFVLGRNKAGTLKLSEDDVGLVSEITPPDTQQARDLLVSIERGDITQMSFAFETLVEEWVKGEGKEPDLRTLVKVRLYDVSPVTYPFYDGTDIAVRSHDQWRDVSGLPKAPWRRELLRRRIRIFDMAAGNQRI